MSDRVTEAWVRKYDGWEEAYRSSPAYILRQARRSPVPAIIRWSGFQRGDSVIEVGCGGGSMGLAFAALGAQLVLLDNADHVLSSARANKENLDKRLGRDLPVSFVRGDMLKYETQEQFDLCISDGLIEHWPTREERVEVLRTHTALVRPGGSVAVTVPNNCHPWSNRWRARGWPWTDPDNPLCEATLTPQDLLHEMECAGLSAVKCDGYLVWDTLCKWPKSWLKSLLVKAMKVVLGYDRVGPWPLPRQTRLTWGTLLLVVGRRS